MREHTGELDGKFDSRGDGNVERDGKMPALQGNEGAGKPEGESKTAGLPSRLRASLQCSG